MLKFDYTLYPGKTLEKVDFEIDEKQEAIVSIITPYYNGHKYIDETANSVLNQTFPYWEWIIIDDKSTEKESVEKLKEIEKIDSRIKVLYKENEGAAAARDYGVKKSTKSSKYIVFLDADDLIEKTYLECCYWTLETNPKASWAYTDVVNFEGKNFLWRKWYNPKWEQEENILTVTAFLKKEDFNEVGGFGLKEKKVYEDWCLWLKLIRNGKFPVRISSLSMWYRIKPIEESELKKSNSENKERAMKLVNEIRRNIIYPKEAIQYPREEYNWEKIVDEQESIVKVQRKQNNKTNILMIIPWIVTGGADKFNLDLISRLDSEKYEFTIITTLPVNNEWKQDFEKYATIYDLTTFLDRKNWISFINYIIEKNNINIIFNTNSQYGYSILPYLKARYNNIPIIDYVHMEEWYVRDGAFSRDSSNDETVIDKTYTCNGNSKKIFEEYFGRKKDEVETMYIGVDEKKFDSSLLNKEKILKEFNISNVNEKYIISFICRIAEQKRPYLFVEVLKQLSKRRSDFIVVIAGDGPLLMDIKKKIKRNGLNDKVVFLGNVKETDKVYKISDLTVNCSIKEGLALTAYESLAMGVPVISSDVGGQKELINSEVGIIVPCVQDETQIWDFNYKEEEIMSYVDGIEKILNNIDSYKSKCRERILNGFTIDNMVQRMDKEFQNLIKNPNKEKIENGQGLSKNIRVTKELMTQFLIASKDEYNWLCKEFTSKNVHVILKYDNKAKKQQFYEHTLEYKIKHPIVVVLRKMGIYDKLRKLLGWEKRR